MFERVAGLLAAMIVVVGALSGDHGGVGVGGRVGGAGSVSMKIRGRSGQGWVGGS